MAKQYAANAKCKSKQKKRNLQIILEKYTFY